MSRWLLVLAAAMITTGGCAEDNKSSMRQRQDEVLRDPWNYSPFEDRTDISGGGISEFNKDAFKKDVNSVFSP